MDGLRAASNLPGQPPMIAERHPCPAANASQLPLRSGSSILQRWRDAVRSTGAPPPRHLPPLPPLPPGWNKHPPLPGPAHVHALACGMTYWQVALITAGAATAAQLAALAARRRAVRRHRRATS
jgi:hypothetical protein